MAFTGGPLSMIGIVPSFTNNLGEQTSSSGIVQAQNQVWQGAGQAFSGQPGQPLTGDLTGSVINVALNPDTLGNVAGLAAGNNLQAPSVGQFLSGTQAFGMNNQIGQSLGAAGAFGALMSVGGSAALSALGGASSAVSSVASALIGAANYIMFPGGGGEGPSNFAGVSYTLQDVTFSLQPANKGPQTFGTSSANSVPTTSTTLPANQYTSMPPLAGSPTANALKSTAMTGDLSMQNFVPSVNNSLTFSSSPL